MDWEPAESYGMDVDENGPAETPYFLTQLEEPYSSDVYMASTAVEEVHMSSPMLISQPLGLPLQTDKKSTFFLPPLNLNTKPIVFPPLNIHAFPPLNIHAFPPLNTHAFPPLNIHAFSLLTLEDRVGLSEVKQVPPQSSPQIYMPAALPEPSTPPNTRDMDQHPRLLSSNSDCRPTSKSGTALQGVAPILTLVHNPEPLLDILEESLQAGDTRTAALKDIGSSEGPDETLGNDTTPSDGGLFLESATPPGWPHWIVHQDTTPSTSHPVFAETDSSNRTVDEDPALNSQYTNLETSDSPEATNSQAYVSSKGPDETLGNDITPSDGGLILESATPPGWPHWIVNQDTTPSTPHAVFAETDSSNRTVDEDPAPNSQYTNLETSDSPEATNSQAYVSSKGPDETLGNDITPSDGGLILESATPPGWPHWIVHQDTTPSTHHPVFAETDSSNRTVDEDPAPNSQYTNLENSTAFHPPEATNSVDCGVDLLGLFNLNPDISNFCEDNPVLRAFGGSSLEDLDWIHEGFRATNVPDTCIEPYDWPLVSDISPDLISFDSAYDLGHRPVETSLVLATTHSGSFELSSFKSGDAIQSQSNPFRTSTPAPCDISESSLVVEPTLDNMAFDSTPEIVIDTYDSQSFLSYYPASDIPEIPDIPNVLSCSPFNPIYFQASALDGITKAAYTFERNARRNVESFKRKLSIEVQKLRVRTKTSTKFLESQDIQTTTHAGSKIDVKYDVFGEVTDKSSARSTKKDASTQTEELRDDAYSIRRPRRYSPYARYSPYRKLGRDFTFDSSDLRYTPLKSHSSVTSGISCDSPSPVFIDCSIQGPIVSEHDKETGLAIRDNSGELEEDDQEEMEFPGAYPIGQADDLLIREEFISGDELETGLAVRNNSKEPEDDDQEKEMSMPGAYPIEWVTYDLLREEFISAHELETGLAVRNNSKEPEEDDQKKEMSMPGAYPIEWVIYEPAKQPAKRIVKVPWKKHSEAAVLPRRTVYYSLKERLFACLFGW